MSALTDAVHELTRDHSVTISRDPYKVAQEQALLDQLEDAKSGTSSGGGGVNRRTAPLGIDPLVIEQDMIRTMHHTVSVHDRYGLASMPLKAKVATWAGLVDERTAEVHLTDWVARIRGLFLHYQDLPITCPRCGCRYVSQDEGDQVIRQAAIVACKETLTASCRNWECGSVWAGVDELHSLGAVAGP